MPDDVPEADALEQLQSPHGAAAVVDAPELGAEVPEADAIEQAQGIDGRTTILRPTIGSEVPENDAIDQAHVVELDDDYRE
jgi:hypothetical protein